MPGPRSISSTSPLQSVKTCTAKLFRKAGTMSAIRRRGTSPTTLLCEAQSESSGFAASAQQRSNIAGLQSHCIEPAFLNQAVHSVLESVLANATPCRHCTLPELQIGTMPRMQAGLMITLLAPILWLGGQTPSVVVGNSPSIRAQTALIGPLGQSMFNRGSLLQSQPEPAGMISLG